MDQASTWRVRRRDSGHKGDVEGLGPKWKRGYGRWIGGVLVWTRAPLYLQTTHVPVDGLGRERSAHPAEVKRLGDEPVVIELDSDQARVEIAASAEHRNLVTAFVAPPLNGQGNVT